MTFTWTKDEIGTLRFLGNNSVGVHVEKDSVALRFGRGLFYGALRFNPQHAEQIGTWMIEAAHAARGDRLK